MKIKHIFVALLVLMMLVPSVFAESESDDSDDEDDDSWEHSYPYKLTGKLSQGASGIFALGQKKYAVIFKESKMDGSQRVAKFVIESGQLRDEFVIGEEKSKTLKDGVIFFLNDISTSNEGSGSSGQYRVEFTLSCDQKCQGFPMKADDSYDDKEKYYKDCKYKCYQSCDASTEVGLNDAQKKCVSECYTANCASIVQPTPYPYPNPKEQCRLNFNKCLEMVKDLKAKQECEEKFNSCLNDISQRPMSGDGSMIKPSERPISQGACGEGCSVNGERQKCVPYGTRLTVDGNPSYCDIDGQVKKQHEDGLSANNNYECRSNSARYGICENVAEQTNIINKIFGWLARIFG